MTIPVKIGSELQAIENQVTPINLTIQFVEPSWQNVKEKVVSDIDSDTFSKIILPLQVVCLVSADSVSSPGTWEFDVEKIQVDLCTRVLLKFPAKKVSYHSPTINLDS